MVGLDSFCITVHKGQFDNVQMLTNLSSEYLRYIGEATLNKRKTNLTNMNSILERNNFEITKTKAKDLY